MASPEGTNRYLPAGRPGHLDPSAMGSEVRRELHLDDIAGHPLHNICLGRFDDPGCAVAGYAVAGCTVAGYAVASCGVAGRSVRGCGMERGPHPRTHRPPRAGRCQVDPEQAPGEQRQLDRPIREEKAEVARRCPHAAGGYRERRYMPQQNLGLARDPFGVAGSRHTSASTVSRASHASTHATAK